MHFSGESICKQSQLTPPIFIKLFKYSDNASSKPIPTQLLLPKLYFEIDACSLCLCLCTSCFLCLFACLVVSCTHIYFKSISNDAPIHFTIHMPNEKFKFHMDRNKWTNFSIFLLSTYQFWCIFFSLFSPHLFRIHFKTHISDKKYILNLREKDALVCSVWCISICWMIFLLYLSLFFVPIYRIAEGFPDPRTCLLHQKLQMVSIVNLNKK